MSEKRRESKVEGSSISDSQQLPLLQIAAQEEEIDHHGNDDNDGEDDV